MALGTAVETRFLISLAVGGRCQRDCGLGQCARLRGQCPPPPPHRRSAETERHFLYFPGDVSLLFFYKVFYL